MFAMHNARDSWGRWKYAGVAYDETELADIPVCVKSVNSWARDWLYGVLERNIALKYNRLICRAYARVPTIYLIRHPEAVCNGWMRRGCSPDQAGKWYRDIVERMLADRNKRPDDVMFVEFGDVLGRPAEVVLSAYRFLGVEAMSLEKFHLKSKKVLSKSGEHTVISGVEESMSWVPAAQLAMFIDRGVDLTQRQMLSDRDRAKLSGHLGGCYERIRPLFHRPWEGA